MRRLRAITLVSLLASPAAALKRPQTKAELAELTAISAKMAGERTSYETDLRLWRLAFKKIDGKIDKEAEIAALNQQLATRDAAHAAVMTDIVKRTVALYDIQPGPTSGHIVVGHFVYSRPQWSPVFAPEVAQKDIPVPNGKPIPLYAHGSYAAITWADG